MARAGYCHDCQAYAYLDDEWVCPARHPRERVNGWYDPDTGQPLSPPWAAQALASDAQAAAPAAAPAPASPSGPTTRAALLEAIVAALAQYPGYSVAYGTDTDIVLSNKVADGSWGTGKKKVDFEAIMKAVEPERTLYYWEILKEKSVGLSFGGVEGETTFTSGTKRWGTKNEAIIGPAGTVAWDWDYGKTRQIVESAAGQLGWTVKTVLRKSSAQW